ncbi:hypothetical protein ACP70R_018460 [Stipagrostis hirtigluma subsp. patula]
MRVTIRGGLQLVGKLMAFDLYMNLVLGDCEEFRRLPPSSFSKTTGDRDDPCRPPLRRGGRLHDRRGPTVQGRRGGGRVGWPGSQPRRRMWGAHRSAAPGSPDRCGGIGRPHALTMKRCTPSFLVGVNYGVRTQDGVLTDIR